MKSMNELMLSVENRQKLIDLSLKRYALARFENTPNNEEFSELAARIEALEVDQVEAALFIVDAAGYSVSEALEIVEGYSYRIHDGNMSDVARQYIEEVYGEDFIFDIVEKAAGRHFAYYMEFDYEGLGRDMRIEGNYYECEDRGQVLEILD
jgi:hypothetical protein